MVEIRLEEIIYSVKNIGRESKMLRFDSKQALRLELKYDCT